PGLLAQLPARGTRPPQRQALLDAVGRPRPPREALPGRRPGGDTMGSKRTRERADHAAKGAPARRAPGADRPGRREARGPEGLPRSVQAHVTALLPAPRRRAGRRACSVGPALPRLRADPGGDGGGPPAPTHYGFAVSRVFFD